MTNVEKLAREICEALGYDPDMEIMLHPGALFMKTLMGKGWQKYEDQARNAIIKKTLSEYAAQNYSTQFQSQGDKRR